MIRIYPQSCTCVVSGALKKTCELFKCTCTCDLTAQVCDYNCCCDPDCSNDQVLLLCTDESILRFPFTCSCLSPLLSLSPPSGFSILQHQQLRVSGRVLRHRGLLLQLRPALRRESQVPAGGPAGAAAGPGLGALCNQEEQRLHGTPP